MSRFPGVHVCVTPKVPPGSFPGEGTLTGTLGGTLSKRAIVKSCGSVLLTSMSQAARLWLLFVLGPVLSLLSLSV